MGDVAPAPSLAVGGEVATSSSSSRDAAQELYTELECEVYHELEDFVSDPAFLKALQKPPPKPSSSKSSGFLNWCVRSKPPPAAAHQSIGLAAASSSGAGEVYASLEANDPDAATAAGASSASCLLDGDDEFVMLDKRDAVEAFAFYIAAVIMEMPEAQALPPKKLQEALVQTLRSLKKSRFQHVCSGMHRAYRWSALAYSTFQVYQNPWLVQAVLTALWALTRMPVRRFLLPF